MKVKPGDDPERSSKLQLNLDTKMSMKLQSGTDLVVSYSTARHHATPQQKSLIVVLRSLREVQYGMEILLIDERLHLESTLNGHLKSCFHITRQQIAVVAPSFPLVAM